MSSKRNPNAAICARIVAGFKSALLLSELPLLTNTLPAGVVTRNAESVSEPSRYKLPTILPGLAATASPGIAAISNSVSSGLISESIHQLHADRARLQAIAEEIGPKRPQCPPRESILVGEIAH